MTQWGGDRWGAKRWGVGGGLGQELITGTDSDMSGPNNWNSTNLGAFDVNTTLPGKLYILGNGSTDTIILLNALESGKEYQISGKFRLNSGPSSAITFGSTAGFAAGAQRIIFTPDGTETTYDGTIVADSQSLVIGRTSTGFNGASFSIDDISVREKF